MSTVKIRVPASSANIGPGFDSIGLALNLYNVFSFEEISRELEVVGSLDNEDPRDNLVYTSMIKTFERIGYRPRGLKITIESDIPPARGLGSSASCILAGVIGANKMAGSPLSQDEIFNISTEIEGHPDNIAPALFGGFICSLMEGANIYYNKLDIAKGLTFVAIIPDFTLSTKMAREVLPRKISYGHAVENVSRVSLLLSALSNGRFDLLKPALKDKLHQPYRGELIKGFDSVMDKIYDLGALGGYLSGAGPTIMAIIKENDTAFVKDMKNYLESVNFDWKVIELQIDLEGTRIIENL